MIYAYIRVSTEKQTTENQRHEILGFAKKREFIIERWIAEKISSTKKMEDRKFHSLLKSLRNDDVLIVSEISRIGRNLLQIMSILNACMEKNVIVYSIKEGYELGNNINSKVLAFAFGLSAEIERNLISQRTKESLARLKAEGKKLGRPIGSKKKKPILLIHTDFINEKIQEGASQIDIARALKVHRHTVKKWLNRHPLIISEKYSHNC